MSKQPPSALTASAIGPCPTIIKIVGRPGTGNLPRTIALPDHPHLVKHPVIALKLINLNIAGTFFEFIDSLYSKTYYVLE